MNRLIVVIIVMTLFCMAGSSGAKETASSPFPSQQYVQNNNLTGSIGTGLFEFRSNVEGARVYLDGMDVGTISGGILQVSVPVFDNLTSRHLMMKADGYSTYNETILQSPKVGATLIVRGILQAVPKNMTGTLSLAVSPPGAQVSIDTNPAGVVAQSGILTLRYLKAGYHTIGVTMPGYQDSEQRVNVEANLETKVRFMLVPVTTGTILITSTPPGARVNMNGAPYGITPVNASDINNGSYTIDVALSGYQPYQTQVHLAAGQTVPVSATLKPVPTQPPTTLPTTQPPTPTPTPTQAGLSPGIVVIGLLAIVLMKIRRE